MRVLMISPCYYPVRGGTETIVRNLAITLNKNVIQTDVMTFNVNQNRKPKWRGETEKIDGITVFRIPALNWLWKLHSIRITAGVNFVPGRFTNILKNYDILHFHEFELSFPFFSLFRKKPKLLHLHGINPNFLKRHHISRLLLKHVAQMYISISKQMTRELIALGLQESRISYVPNGIDTNFFKPEKPKEENLLLYVGRISELKGLHILIKTLRYLKENVHLVIIGPPDWNTNYYQNLLYLIEKENSKGLHKIDYLGAMEQSEIVKWYQKASLLVLPSYAEGFPVTILEALSCETPVIATPVGGIPEIIENNKTGILIPPGDPKRLAEALAYLLENETIRFRMASEGQKLVKEQYSIDVVCKKLRSIYSQLNELL
ncbi:MAG: glycosyltransferase family 4 protein [Candidatus Bathyarchaeota archaeon]|nr:glycosyltransferase family 4 protein [Candidatus Bathyarchaeota archaeon]